MLKKVFFGSVHRGYKLVTCWNPQCETLSSLMLLCRLITFIFQPWTFLLVKQMRASIWPCLLLSPSLSFSLCLCVCVQAPFCLGDRQLRQGPLNVWWGNNWWNPASQHQRGAALSKGYLCGCCKKRELFLLHCVVGVCVSCGCERFLYQSVEASVRRWSESGCISVWVDTMTSLCKWRKRI